MIHGYSSSYFNLFLIYTVARNILKYIPSKITVLREITRNIHTLNGCVNFLGDDKGPREDLLS